MDHCSYIAEPAGAAKAVLLLHGICSTPRRFDFLIPEFDESWAVYNLLLDGHGGSVQDFSKTSMKKWKAQTHAALEDLSRRYDSILLIGYSMGTLLEIEALPKYPKVRGMLLLNVPMRPWVQLKMISLSLKWMRGKKDPSDPILSSADHTVGIALTGKVWQYLGWIPRFLELLGLCRHCRKHWQNIQVPCLAYLGEEDELVSLRSRKYLEPNPHVQLRLMKNTGHFYYAPAIEEQIRTDLRTLMQ